MPRHCTTMTTRTGQTHRLSTAVHADGLANMVGVNVNIGRVNRQGDSLEYAHVSFPLIPTAKKVCLCF